MERKKNKKYQLAIIALLFTLILTSLSSCKNNDGSEMTSGGASIRVNLIAAQSESDIISMDDKSASNRAIQAGSTTQTRLEPWGEHKSLVISLTPTSSLTTSNASTNVTGANKAVTVQQPLANGTKYELLVYNNAGSFVTRQTYTYGQESTAAAMNLNAGQSYTFIVISSNSSSTTPSVVNPNLLSTAIVPNINTALLYFKSTLTLNEGNNNLNVILKHQYSEIKTTVRMDANTTGNITAVNTPVFKTTHSSASLKLSDGVLTYNGINLAGQPLSFTGLGTRILTSPAILVIHPTTTSGVLSFGSLTIDGETKPLNATGLKINPGHRYDLDLTLKTCTQNVSGADGLDWDYAETKGDCTFGNFGCKVGITVNGVFLANGKTLSKSFTAPSADYGFVLDLTKLDNSFNMEVNGVTMANKEIQFQINAASPQNIQFADGSKYESVNTQGGANVPSIYSMTGTAANPLIKIVISRFGEVTLFGSKSSGGPLFPLVLMTGTQFNNFSWNGSGTNHVKVTQLIDGKTTIKGTGAGKKKIACN
ncbi:hypothetical protein [Sphingobacterium faecium]|uniref:hypothetical protein n=1 Tax=Sphingobacterium faecium TaxID=34087 RepID=UPI00320B136B